MSIRTAVEIIKIKEKQITTLRPIDSTAFVLFKNSQLSFCPKIPLIICAKEIENLAAIIAIIGFRTMIRMAIIPIVPTPVLITPMLP